MTRLHVPPDKLADEVVVLASEDHRYLTRVLRLGVGDSLVLFDGTGNEADADIARVGPRAVELKVRARRKVAPTGRLDVTLIQALTKGDKLDLVVQKATELGVGRIIPVTSARAVPRLDAMRALNRRARWQKIARDAARQSGRPDIPEVQPVTALEVALAAAPRDALRLVLWEGARHAPLRKVLPAPQAEGAASPPRVVLVVGPEGGFAEPEIEAARAREFHVVGLGPRVVRTETAALVCLAVLGFVFGDLG
jgi:16S rRNA (uracil1498-N3)-methyltransferase